MTTEAARVAVLGSAGYVGGELLRLLVTHPRMKVVRAVSQSQAGERVDAHHRHLRGATDLTFSAGGAREAAADVDVLFLALGHKESHAAVLELRERLDEPGAPLVCDLSGAFRIADMKAHHGAYGHAGLPELQPSFVYALPELCPPGSLKGARRISSPGCFATAAALCAAPIAATGRVRGAIVLNGVTGASGSGAQAKDTTHFPMRDGNFKAYRVLAHQHEPEVQQTVDRYAAAHDVARATPATSRAKGEQRASAPIVLTTHSGPFTRGIHMTATAELEDARDVDLVKAELQRAYGRSRFVRLVDEPAELKGLVCTNHADVYLAARERYVVITCAIDNLVKGASGQALQSVNLALGLPEDDGLSACGFAP
jgi:N-acetyl-gamma-glutamyl-phosphate/LysW-gamma-L-alpha-aminoadipyl-6-phosphate reductase